VSDPDEPISTQLRQLLGAERDFAGFIEKLREQVLDRDLIATLAAQQNAARSRSSRLEAILRMIGAAPLPLVSMDARTLIERCAADASGAQTAHAPDWVYAITAREFERFKIAAYSRLRADVRLGSNPDVVRLLEENLQEDNSIDSTLAVVIDETLP
jgi:ferritin-like metal-binding protein YciE